jgi:hypothetical protein
MLARGTAYVAILAVAIASVHAPTVATLAAEDKISDSKVVRWVEKTVAERQPRPEDRRFDEIAWVPDIRTAIKLGKEHNRPIFLLTGGGRINTGRC